MQKSNRSTAFVIASLVLGLLLGIIVSVSTGTVKAAPTWDPPTNCDLAIDLLVWDRYDLPDGYSITCQELIDDQQFLVQVYPKGIIVIEFWHPGMLKSGWPSQLDYWVGHAEPENPGDCDVTTQGETRRDLATRQIKR